MFLHSEMLAEEGIPPHEIALAEPGAVTVSVEHGGLVAGFFTYHQNHPHTVLDHFIVAKPFRNTTAGARLFHKMRKHFRLMGIRQVILNLKISQPKLSLFLQNVLHARPYRIDGGSVSMILEV